MGCYLQFLKDYEPMKTAMGSGRIILVTHSKEQLLLFLPFSMSGFHFTWHFPKIAFSFQMISGTHNTENLETFNPYHSLVKSVPPLCQAASLPPSPSQAISTIYLQGLQ